MLDRLVIGTANWGRDYNGHNVSEKEQNLIMEYMKEVGIEWLDVATAYGTEYVGKGLFYRIVKVRQDDPIIRVDKYDIVMAHNTESYRTVKTFMSGDRKTGVSVEEVWKETIADAEVIEIPFSIMNRSVGLMKTFIQRPKFIARSIFCKGKALKHFSPRECIDFVLMNPRIDKVILGVDSVDQLKENVAHLVKMEKFTHNEEVDTRKFERKS